MISVFIRLGIVLTAITGLLLILPDSAGLPADVQTSLTYMIQQARLWDFIVPFNTLFTVIKASFFFWLGVAFFLGLAWFLKHLTQGTSGS